MFLLTSLLTFTIAVAGHATEGEGKTRWCSNKTSYSCNLDSFKHLLVTSFAIHHQIVSTIMLYLTSFIVFMLSLEVCGTFPFSLHILGLLPGDYSMSPANGSAINPPRDGFNILDFLLFNFAFFWILLLRTLARWLLLPAAHHFLDSRSQTQQQQQQAERELHERIVVYCRIAIAAAATLIALPRYIVILLEGISLKRRTPIVVLGLDVRSKVHQQPRHRLVPS